jgi:hypothetical protein
VIVCKRDKAEEALLDLREITGKLKLTVNFTIRAPGARRQHVS